VTCTCDSTRCPTTQSVSSLLRTPLYMRMYHGAGPHIVTLDVHGRPTVPAVEGSTETQILASRPSSRWSARRQLRPPRHPPCRRPAWPRGHSDAQTRCRSSITRRLFARGARRAALAPLMHPPSTHATQFHSVPAGGHRWLAGARTRDQRRGAPFSHHQLAPPPPSSLVSAI
jgi:hypothetical protein